jgi:hypothetical protein
VFYVVADATILRFMMEACWAPLMAAFTVTLDQSNDKAATSQCLNGLRSAVHVTSVMCLQTQRDAFLTSIAKFTSLHSAADMKQKNVDAVKVGGTETVFLSWNLLNVFLYQFYETVHIRFLDLWNLYFSLLPAKAYFRHVSCKMVASGCANSEIPYLMTTL